jgi:hypothetical protein
VIVIVLIVITAVVLLGSLFRIQRSFKASSSSQAATSTEGGTANKKPRLSFGQMARDVDLVGTLLLMVALSTTLIPLQVVNQSPGRWSNRKYI